MDYNYHWLVRIDYEPPVLHGRSRGFQPNPRSLVLHEYCGYATIQPSTAPLLLLI